MRRKSIESFLSIDNSPADRSLYVAAIAKDILNNFSSPGGMAAEARKAALRLLVSADSAPTSAVSAKP